VVLQFRRKRHLALAQRARRRIARHVRERDRNQHSGERRADDDPARDLWRHPGAMHAIPNEVGGQSKSASMQAPLIQARKNQEALAVLALRGYSTQDARTALGACAGSDWTSQNLTLRSARAQDQA